MRTDPIFAWILDSGGAGRGAWQGGVIYELMRWARQHHCYPLISMGASAGGYAAADVATETEQTVIKGWTKWGNEELPPANQIPKELRGFWGLGKFRLHLNKSIEYVMGKREVAAVFNGRPNKRLLVFTTRVRRKDGKAFGSQDGLRYFMKSISRKFPLPLKYLPGNYHEEPVIFSCPLPKELHSEYIRPLTILNYHRVIEASCLVPLAMGTPLAFSQVDSTADRSKLFFPGDENAVFMDGGFTLKMPMATFREDDRFKGVAQWAKADKTVVFCCDPHGNLWETSSRLRELGRYRPVQEDIRGNRLLLVHPVHKVGASFLCHDNAVILRTFQRGREQAGRLLRSDGFRRFIEN
jgi:hypothetical protein